MSVSRTLALLNAFSASASASAFAFAATPRPRPRPRRSCIHPPAAMPPISQRRGTRFGYGTFAMMPESTNRYDQDCRNNTDTLSSERPRESRAATRESIPEMPEEQDSATSRLSAMARPIANANAIASFANAIASSKTLQARAVLLLVALLYGTLNVTLRGIYATPGPPVASVLSSVRQLLSVVAFVPLLALSNHQDQTVANGNDVESSRQKKRSNDTAEVAERVRPMWLAALELAFWNFGAQGLINAGLLFSPAARAAFLTQTSVVMTPLISRFAGESIANTVWGACALALAGLFLISTSASDGTDIPSAAEDIGAAVSFSQGDAMILLGALSWSTYIFRTSKIANSYRELDLQFSKNALLALMYGVWFAYDAVSTLASAGTSLFSAGWTEALTSLWAGWNSPFVWLLLIYSAIGPGAVADLLQQKGQKETSASESNIILCLESVFATLCAFVLLGEVSSFKEILGGSMIVLAAIIASR